MSWVNAAVLYEVRNVITGSSDICYPLVLLDAN